MRINLGRLDIVNYNDSVEHIIFIRNLALDDSIRKYVTRDLERCLVETKKDNSFFFFTFII